MEPLKQNCRNSLTQNENKLFDACFDGKAIIFRRKTKQTKAMNQTLVPPDYRSDRSCVAPVEEGP